MVRTQFKEKVNGKSRLSVNIRSSMSGKIEGNIKSLY